MSERLKTAIISRDCHVMFGHVRNSPTNCNPRPSHASGNNVRLEITHTKKEAGGTPLHGLRNFCWYLTRDLLSCVLQKLGAADEINAGV